MLLLIVCSVIFGFFLLIHFINRRENEKQFVNGCNMTLIRSGQGKYTSKEAREDGTWMFSS